MKLTLKLTDDLISLIKWLKFEPINATSYGIDTYGLWGGTNLYEDMANILGWQDKVIPETLENIMGPRYEDEFKQKMEEYDAFIAGLKLMSNEQVIDSAYEKVIKSDILIECENGRLDQKEAKALYLEKYPLDRIYQDWLKSDISETAMLRDSIDDTAKDIVKERREKQRESR